jgi:pentatricopeptide repeat protein
MRRLVAARLLRAGLAAGSTPKDVASRLIVAPQCSRWPPARGCAGAGQTPLRPSAAERGRWQNSDVIAMKLLHTDHEEQARRILTAAQPNPKVLTMVIGKLGEGLRGRALSRGLPQLAWLRAWSREHGLLDVTHCNAFISAYGNGGFDKQALQIREEMREAGLSMNRDTYTALVTTCVNGGQWERALALVGELKQAGLQPDVQLYTATIAVCAKAAQWQHALALLEEMQATGVGPDVRAYTSVINACGQGGQWERAMDMLQELRTAGLSPTVVTYNCLIAACVKSEQWDRALDTLEEMRMQGLQPTEGTTMAFLSNEPTGERWKHVRRRIAQLQVRPCPRVTGAPRQLPA